MSSIFSTQNLQTFLRRKNLRPPGPPSRGPPGPRPPPNRGRSPPGLPPSLRGGLSLDAACSGAFVSSAIFLLSSGISCGPQKGPGIRDQGSTSRSPRGGGRCPPAPDPWPPVYAVAGASAAGAAWPSSEAAAGCALTFFLASSSAL